MSTHPLSLYEQTLIRAMLAEKKTPREIAEFLTVPDRDVESFLAREAEGQRLVGFFTAVLKSGEGIPRRALQERERYGLALRYLEEKRTPTPEADSTEDDPKTTEGAAWALVRNVAEERETVEGVQETIADLDRLIDYLEFAGFVDRTENNQ